MNSLYTFIFLMIMGVGSALFSIMVFLAYFTKSIKYELKNKLYIIFLVITFLIELNAIILALCYGLGHEIVQLHSCIKLYWLSVYIWNVWLLFYCLYYYTGMDKTDYKGFKDLFKNRNFILFLVLSIFILIGLLLLPVGNIDFKNFAIAKGNIPTYIMGVHLFAIVVVFIYIISKKEKIDHEALGIIILNLIMSFMFNSIQLVLPDIAVFTVANFILLASLYLFFENPDLYTIDEIAAAKDLATKSKLSKTEFLANISHDVRSPMNTILELTESILNTNEDNKDRIKENIQSINVSSHNLIETFNNIVDVSKIEVDTEALNEKEYSLKQVLINLTSIVNARIKQKPVKFIMNVDQTIPNMLYGDSVKIYQILVNILSNSIKNTEVGKISLTLEQGSKGNQIILKFRITDSGSGIPKEIADDLSVKLSQPSKLEEKVEDGKGVGLAIAKKYIDLLDGKIWFETLQKAGTTFYIEIPQNVVSTTQLGDINNTVTDVTKKELLDCSNHRVLIVDDDHLSLQISSRLLSRYNFQIDTCDNGQDCVYRIKNNETYDLIFIDPFMPEMDGVETLQVIKKLGKYYTIPPTIALTANVFSTARQHYLKAGFDEYLAKPINLLELDEIINKYMSKDKEKVDEK